MLALAMYAACNAVAVTVSDTQDIRRQDVAEQDVRMQTFTERAGDVQRELIRIWSEVLDVPASRIGAEDHFFSLGGNSLLLARVMSAVNARFFAGHPDEGLAITDFLTHGTVSALSAHIVSELGVRHTPQRATESPTESCIAIVGMACRFPGAPDVATFWRNVREGVESITSLPGQPDPEEDHDTAGRRRKVRAVSFVEGVQLFDADYFGMTTREAALLSPEQRLLIECSEEALQDAGYGVRASGRNIGVFIGTGLSSYLLEHVAGTASDFESAHGMALLASNTCAASRIAYLLDLTGPAVTLDTACSSSLVAVHTACRALLDGECEMALAGGATVRRFAARGYYAEEGGILSPDGHCRPFDEAARGTVGASGGGVILLKRLSAAIADGDCIRAIIRGTAVNNDGGSRAGYTAPSVAGQADAIRRALAVAKVEPADIQYLETHGTGTALGDLIEIAALKEVFSSAGAARSECTLGTLKANVGHLEAAAGIAGLMKVALALEHREMPPAIHFRNPAPALGLDKTTFTFNRHLKSWPATRTPRRAGVSSFGIGGTNAHAILEEPVRAPRTSSRRPAQLLVLSARTGDALRDSCRRLARRFETDPHLSLADTAYTLQIGRAAHHVRDFVVASSPEEAVRELESRGRAEAPIPHARGGENPPVVFMFPGQGSQFPHMLEDVYASEPVYRAHLDRCSQLLRPHIGKELLDVLAAPAEALAQTVWCQPALFAVEYSLAQLWQSWGVKPSVMIGHSLGEYVAACLAGVFTLEDALQVVAARGRLVQATPVGRMLAVRMSAKEVTPFLRFGCSLACVNGPTSCVLSGPPAAMESVQSAFAEAGVKYVELASCRAFHSSAMDEILDEFATVLRRVRWGEAHVPYISNLTGAVVKGDAASSPQYWVSHLRETVNFAAGLQRAFEGEPRILLEVGPGQVLTGLAQAMPGSDRHTIVPSARRASDESGDARHLMRAAGRLWQRGLSLDWRAFNAGEKVRRVSLPAYPFERQRHWIEPAAAMPDRPVARRRAPLAKWFHVPVWKERPRLPSSMPRVIDRDGMAGACCLLIEGGTELEQALARRLAGLGARLISVSMSNRFSSDADRYTIDPRDEEGFTKVISDLEAQGLAVTSVVHAGEASASSGSLQAPDQGRLLKGVCSVLDLCKALTCERRRPVTITLLTHSAHALSASETPDPCGAMLAAVAGVISTEFPEIACRSVDFMRAGTDEDGKPPAWLEALVDEIVAPADDTLIVLRGRDRWVRTFESLPLPPPPAQNALLRARGVYLVTGGLGGIGRTIAEFLGRALQARLILVGRRTFPDRGEWSRWLETQDPAHPTCETIRAIQALERAGAECLIMSADVSCPGDMERVAAQVRSRFGELHGVVHAAGIAGGGAVFLKTREALSQVLAPKVMGTWALHEACRHFQPDFFLCCSSLASVVSLAGRYDYSAANAYQDAFCRAHDGRTSTRFIAVNWDAWDNVGMAAQTRVPTHMKRQWGRELTEGISPEEGVEVFQRVLAHPRPQWLIDARGLLRTGISDGSRAEHSAEYGGQQADCSSMQPGRTAAKSEVASHASESGVRDELAGIWKELLGIGACQDDDDFFTLGGDSLLAVELRTRLEQQFARSVSLRALLRDPTLAAMAKVIEGTAEQAETNGARAEERRV